MGSLEESDKAAADVAVAPRITLADIENSIASHHYVHGDFITENAKDHILTICVVCHKSGFNVVGKSVPMSPENFNANLGKKFAYEDCVRQLWPLMAFAEMNK